MEKNMANEQQHAPMTNLCGGGCGFYGSSATDGLCSKCFKDSLKRTQDPNRLSPTALSSAVSAVINEEMEKVAASTSNPPSRVVIPEATTDTSDKEVVDESSAKSSVDTTSVAVGSSSNDGDGAVDVAPPSEPVVDDIAPKPKNRCHHCNKRVGLTGFPCRCDGVFCGDHRYSDQHTCSFDYKAFGAEQIRKNNPQVVGSKIDKL